MEYKSTKSKATPNIFLARGSRSNPKGMKNIVAAIPRGIAE